MPTPGHLRGLRGRWRRFSPPKRRVRLPNIKASAAHSPARSVCLNVTVSTLRTRTYSLNMNSRCLIVLAAALGIGTYNLKYLGCALVTSAMTPVAGEENCLCVACCIESINNWVLDAKAAAWVWSISKFPHYIELRLHATNTVQNKEIANYVV